MEIEYKNLPITVQTINVNGRKMSRQFLQQIPIGEAIFYGVTNFAGTKS